MKKSSFNRFVICALAGLLVVTTSVRAEEFVRYKAKPLGSKVRIDGSANVHEWAMEGTLIGGFLDVPAGVTLDSTQGAVAGAADGKLSAKVDIFIPVTSIKNGKYESMDEVMQEAMGEKDHPRITFHLTDLAIKQPHTANTPFECDAKGDLSMNGVTNKISMPVTIETVDKTKLKVVAANIPVKMTDFQIKPPVKLGVFITSPDVKISFEWVAGLSAKSAESK